MKSAIIKSETSLRRYPVLAFLMSLLFTGLGQIYNGDLSKGIVLFILRILSVIIVPLYLIIQNSFSIIFIITAAAFHIFVWIFSSAEAIYSTKDKQSYNLKKYNVIMVYAFYVIINAVFMTFCIFLIISIFSINKIQNDDMNPTLLKGEYVLINKYTVNNIGAGDVIVYSSEKTFNAGRIIAGDADMVSKKGDDYYINDSALSYTVISKQELERSGLPNSEDLFFEINGEKKYPVLKSDKKQKGRVVESITLGKDEFLLAFDNRIKNDAHETVALNSISGRVEGVIYSKKLKRIFSPNYPNGK